MRPGDHAMNPRAATAKTCLIGHTGFVGSTLARQFRFEAQVNSATIDSIGGSAFDMVVCAAAPGSMFEANRDPEADRAKVHALIEQLERVRAERFVLISSIAVLADFAGGDDESTAAFQRELAYGRHRRALEAFVEDHFANHLIVRLPALYGPGLRKNFLFDLMNPVPSMLTPDRLDALTEALDRPLSDLVRALYTFVPATSMHVLDRQRLCADARRGALEQAVSALGYSAVQFHHRKTSYQYYGVERLWADIGTALAAGLTHIHLATQPLEAEAIHQRLTGVAMPETPARLHREDMRTRHADLWGETGPYLASAATVLDRLAAFHARERAPA